MFKFVSCFGDMAIISSGPLLCMEKKRGIQVIMITVFHIYPEIKLHRYPNSTTIANNTDIYHFFSQPDIDQLIESYYMLTIKKFSIFKISIAIRFKNIKS